MTAERRRAPKAFLSLQLGSSREKRAKVALGEGACSPETQQSHILANVPHRPGWQSGPGGSRQVGVGRSGGENRPGDSDSLLPWATGRASGEKTEEPPTPPRGRLSRLWHRKHCGATGALTGSHSSPTAPLGCL